MLPIGIQPQLQANYAFAEINSQSINEEVEYSDEGQTSSYSSPSETKSKMDVKSPFGSADDDNKKVNPNIILPDIVGPDLLPGTQPGSTASSHQISTQSTKDFQPNSVDKSSSDIKNAHGSVMAGGDKLTTTELTSLDSQVDTLNNNVTKKVNDVNSTITDDKPSTENSQSQLTPQPRYKSYRDYIDNSNANKNNDNVIISDDKVGTELSTTNSGINSVIDNANDDANENLVVPDNQSNTSQSQSTDSQSQLTPQPRYKSYRDYIENSNSSDLGINATSDTQATGLSSIDSQIDTANSNVNDSANGKVNENLNVSPSQSTPELTSNSTTQSQSSDEPKYKSYRDYINSNTNVNKIENVIVTGQSNGESNSTESSHTGDTHSDVNENVIAPDVQLSTESTSSATVSAQSSNKAYGDFNGDGFDDLAIRVSFEDVNTGGPAGNEGGISIIYGSSNGLSATSPRPDQFWNQNNADVNDVAENDDSFGSSLAVGDFNGDGKDDLAIGVPLEDVDTGAGTIDNAGAVNVLYGSSNGLSATSPRPDQFWTQNNPDVNDLAENNDQFGTSLSSGDFNGDGKDDLAIGVSAESIDTGDPGAGAFAGAVNVLYGSSNGLSATSPRPDQFWTQSTTDVNDLSETADIFGRSLSSGDFNGDGKDDLAIGVPLENVDTGAAGIGDDAGAVNVLYGSSNGLSATSPRPDQFWTQNNPDVNDLAENNDGFGTSLSSGDFNGDGKDDLAIGVSAESIDTGDPGAGTFAGAVNVLYGSSNGLSATSPRPDQFWTQNNADVNDLSETGDTFGGALSSGDFNGDGKDDLAIGVPLENVDTGAAGIGDDAGAVNVLYGSSNGLSATSPRPDQFWTQNNPDVNDLVETQDFFGEFLYSADFNGDGRNDIAIAVPLQAVDTGAGTIDNAGAVEVIYGSSNGLSATSPRPDQFWTQNSQDVNDLSETGDNFGGGLELD